ncbi:penicillin-binding protein 2, partial [Micromonospora echinofusca]|nr:penicillin-binding protein 2 [Micromonospora echinofusca]
MPPRSDEPRRDPPGTRRGSARGGSGAQPEPGLGGISEARAYTPRGRTVRESAEQRRTPRSSRSGDPFRPALQVLDGGREVPVRTTRRSTPAAGAKTVRTVPAGTGR